MAALPIIDYKWDIVYLNDQMNKVWDRIEAIELRLMALEGEIINNGKETQKTRNTRKTRTKEKSEKQSRVEATKN